jgi:hypothetical protein
MQEKKGHMIAQQFDDSTTFGSIHQYFCNALSLSSSPNKLAGKSNSNSSPTQVAIVIFWQKNRKKLLQ